ncbi:phytoene/squalene synthase family protein [Bogoriella caseilytica]|uniref:Phytoene/squalene synthetase n=1 Tax=Bogoriella caseilytica TaxID=56055 RepID=A0A3N2BCN1_9MICO|nr:phytoene/squalene synthase family protein [Bogoriella caseilytica]ROR73023.1 phytoene/squalene synthetase [Bogoriella caseilytica]
MNESTGLELYARTSHQAAAVVLQAYSTSFGLASRLLPPATRGQISDIYALVRIADEVVDGPGAEAGLTGAQQRSALDALEAETLAAMDRCYSTNIVVHAFAETARTCGIGPELVVPFFASMRRDLDPIVDLSEEEYRRYIHGSAEVVGEMCLQAYLVGHDREPDVREVLHAGARHLGAAFQKINFLRDLGDDHGRLGRSYFPGVEPGQLEEADKHAILADIRADLVEVWASMPHLPRGPRRATAAAAGLFTELAARIHHTPARDLLEHRVSVPAPVKLRVVAAAVRRANALGRDT